MGFEILDIAVKVAAIGRDLGLASRTIDADGLIVWMTDASGHSLAPALTHGYAPALMARLGGVRDTKHFQLIYPRGLPREKVERYARDIEFRYMFLLFGIFILAQQRGYHQSSQQVIQNSIEQTVVAEQAGFNSAHAVDATVVATAAGLIVATPSPVRVSRTSRRYSVSSRLKVRRTRGLPRSSVMRESMASSAPSPRAPRKPSRSSVRRAAWIRTKAGCSGSIE